MSGKDGNGPETCKEGKTNTPEISYVAPDGGWGWLVAIGAFITTLIIPFNIQVFSILHAKLFGDNNASTATIAWIFNLCQMVWNLTLTFMPTFCAEFGWRKVAFSGGITMSASFIITSYLERIELLFFTYSILYGVGAGMSVNVWTFVIPRYFEKWRGRVIGVVTCGLSAGQFMSPLLVKSLQEAYGSRGAILIMGAIYLNVCVAAALFQPVEWHLKTTSTRKSLNQTVENDCDASEEGRKTLLQLSAPCKEEYKEQRISYISEFGSTASLPRVSQSPRKRIESRSIKTLVGEDVQYRKQETSKLKRFCNSVYRMLKSTASDVALLRYPRVLMLCASISLGKLIYFNFFIFIPLALTDRGFSAELTAYGLTILGVANVLVRIVVSSLTDLLPFSPRWYYMGGFLVASASAFAFASAAEEGLMFTAMAFYGLGIGASISVYVQIVIEIMGMELMPSTIGTQSFVMLLLSPCVGPIIGYIRDVTQDFVFCLKLVSVLHLVPFFFMALLPLAVNFDRKRQKRNMDGTD